VQFVSLFRLKDLLFTAQQIGMKLNVQHSTFELSLLITAESNLSDKDLVTYFREVISLWEKIENMV
jgi:hypothetical protein